MSQRDMFEAMLSTGKPKQGPSVGFRPAATLKMPIGNVILITGEPKTGKSTSVIDARKPLALDFERRLDYVDIPRVSPLYVPDGAAESETLDDAPRGQKFDFMINWLDDMCSYLSSMDDYLTVSVDTIDAYVQKTIQAYAQDQRGDSQVYAADYPVIYAKLLPVINRLWRLPIDVVILAHVKVDDKGKATMILPPKIAELITYHSQINLHIEVSTNGQANRFFAHNHPNYPSGDGTGKLPRTLPTTFKAIYAAWEGRDPEQYQPNVKIWTPEAPLEE